MERRVGAVKAIRLCFYAPTAHFALPYMISDRKTYPIPPFSTAIGMVCNILKCSGNIRDSLGDEFFMAIVGKYSCLVHEYVWYRNLSVKAHENRFLDGGRRFLGQVEHPGGQSPVLVDTLVDAKFCIYIHTNDAILEKIKESFDKGDYLTTLHAGRAEDIIDEANAEIIEFEKSRVYRTHGYTWLPSPEFSFDSSERYKKLFESIGGVRQLINTVYKVSNGNRIFKKVDVKLYSGSIPMISPFEIIEVFSDPENRFLESASNDPIPLFFTKVVVWK